MSSNSLSTTSSSPPQSYSSTSSMRSRRSTADSVSGGATSSAGSNGSSKIAQDFASIVKFVHSKPFSDELFHTPRTSAHTALRKYIGAATRSKKRRRQAKAGKADQADGGSAAADGDSSMAATASSSVDGGGSGGGGGGSSANGGASSSDGISGHKASCGSSVGSSDCFDVSLSKFEVGLCDALNIQQALCNQIVLKCSQISNTVRFCTRGKTLHVN